MLYIVGTPIGNLKDITYRAVETLKSVDLIACEDTRHSKILLNEYDIETDTISFHGHSGKAKVEKLVTLLQDGVDIALISDAGTPGISDPSFQLLKSVSEHSDIEVVPIPGAAAFLTALMATSFPKDKFLYLGFLPMKKGRQTLLKSFIEEERTIVFYESTHRIHKTIDTLREVLGPERKVCIAREITKKFEEFIEGTLEDVQKEIINKKLKGELTVILGGSKF